MSLDAHTTKHNLCEFSFLCLPKNPLSFHGFSGMVHPRRRELPVPTQIPLFFPREIKTSKHTIWSSPLSLWVLGVSIRPCLPEGWELEAIHEHSVLPGGGFVSLRSTPNDFPRKAWTNGLLFVLVMRTRTSVFDVLVIICTRTAWQGKEEFQCGVHGAWRPSDH